MGKTRKKIKGGSESVNSSLTNNFRGNELQHSGRGTEITNEYLYKKILYLQEQIDNLRSLNYNMMVVKYDIRKLKGLEDPDMDWFVERQIRQRKEEREKEAREYEADERGEDDY